MGMSQMSGTTARRRCWMVLMKAFMCVGGRAQKTRQWRGSLKSASRRPGGPASFVRFGSRDHAVKSGDKILAAC